MNDRIALEYKNTAFDTPEEGDSFFGNFYPNVLSYHRTDERFKFYEKFLKDLYNLDNKKFKQMHKGAAFHAMSRLASQQKRHVESLYYMDLALSEDINKTTATKKSPDTNDKDLWVQTFEEWKNNPSGLFFLLEVNDEYMTETDALLLKRINEYIDDFNKNLSADLTVGHLREHFLKVFIKKPKTRSLVSAFLSYILEFEEIRTMIMIRSELSGSIQPILANLLKGGLIVETMLKIYYPAETSKYHTLGNIYSRCKFKRKYLYEKEIGGTSANSLQEVIDARRGDDLTINAFKITAMIRNTTAHNLGLDDIFATSDNYKLLFNDILTAFFLIVKNENNLNDPK